MNPLWSRTTWFKRINRSLSHKLGSEYVSQRASKQTSEWPSTYIWILDYSGPQSPRSRPRRSPLSTHNHYLHHHPAINCRCDGRKTTFFPFSEKSNKWRSFGWLDQANPQVTAREGEKREGGQREISYLVTHKQTDTHTHTRARPRTHTHTHIYIYIDIYS